VIDCDDAVDDFVGYASFATTKLSLSPIEPRLAGVELNTAPEARAVPTAASSANAAPAAAVRANLFISAVILAVQAVELPVAAESTMATVEALDTEIALALSIVTMEPLVCAPAAHVPEQEMLIEEVSSAVMLKVLVANAPAATTSTTSTIKSFFIC